MIVKLILSISLFLPSMILSQDFLKIAFGNGTSNLSNFTVQIKDGGFTGDIHVKRLKSTLRNLDIEISDNYDNEYVTILLGVVSASADGISITGGERSEFLSVEVGKISYALKDWDLFVTKQGPKDIPSLRADLNIHYLNIKPPNQFVQTLSQEEWRLFNLLSGDDGILDIKKITAEIMLNVDRSIGFKGNLDLPIGKAIATATLTMGRDFKTDPYLDLFSLDITNPSQELKSFIDEMIRSGELPLKKKGTGYSLKMSGDLDNPRIF